MPSVGRLGFTEAYWDARLTPEGEEQARHLAGKLQWRQEAGSPQLVAASPLTRALQTASFAFPDVPTPAPGRAPLRRPPFVATSLARERVGNHSCDGRRERSALEAEFPWTNFSQVAAGPDDMWDLKELGPEGDEDNLHAPLCAERAVRLLQWLWERPEHDIALVTHWVFLLHLLRPFSGLKRRNLQANFGNAELRHVALLPAALVPERLKDEL